MAPCLRFYFLHAAYALLPLMPLIFFADYFRRATREISIVDA